jgi:hypothetical protein
MCIVLFIIVLLLGVTMPAIQSAFVETAVRKDSHQLALMVKTAMLQTAEQHRPYDIDLTSTTMALHPAQADPAAVPDVPQAVDNNNAPLIEDIEANTTLDPANKLMEPDPIKVNAWTEMSPTTWTFEPGELCPTTRVRFARGEAWIELSFNPLTGNVENESTYFP